MILIHSNLPPQPDPVILWDNVLARGTRTAAQVPPFYRDNAIGPQTYDYWKPVAFPVEYRATLPSAETCDCAAVFNHNLGSCGVSIAIQSRTGSGAWVLRFPITTIETDDPLLILFPAGSDDQWRFLFQSGAVLPSIGILMIGKALRPPGGVLTGYQPLRGAQTVDLTPSVSLGGHFVGTRTIRRGMGTTIPLAEQPRAWVEDEAAGFIDHYNRGGTFAWAACPELLQDDVAYCWRGGDAARWSLDAGSEFVAGLNLAVMAYA